MKSIEALEADSARQLAYAAEVEAVWGSESLSGFCLYALVDYHRKEIDSSELAYAFDLLPDNTYIWLGAAHEKVLEADYLTEPVQTKIVAEGSSAKFVLFSRRVRAAMTINDETRTVTINDLGYGDEYFIPSLVELKFDEDSNPEFWLAVHQQPQI